MIKFITVANGSMNGSRFLMFDTVKLLSCTSKQVVVRDLKQTRTATAVNKQLNFTVKNKRHTTNYIYCIFEAYFMIKNV